jgi:DNA-binding transcriptional LysR family regulator
VPSLDDGTEAMLRGATTGCGLTLALRDAFRAEEHPALVAVPFDPPLHHNVTMIWTPDTETTSVRAFAERCAAIGS